jgi:hypothetical protein
MQADAERERLERSIEDDRVELRRALRQLGLSLLIGLNLPKRIRRRPLPWAIGGVAVAAFLIVRSRQRKSLRRKRHWWASDGAQA